MRHGVDLGGPLAALVLDLCLESEPRRFEPARRGAKRFLPIGMGALVEHARIAHAPGDRVERVERRDQGLSAGRQAGGDRALLGSRQEQPAAPAAWRPHATRGPVDFLIERPRDPIAHTPHGGIPCGEPGPPAERLEHLVALVAAGGGARFPADLHHARGKLLANVVERHPRFFQATRHEHAPQRRRELGDAQRHRDLYRRAHRVRSAARPVRASY